jgi:ApbE superfamily uncharacterized protein (UPF0280 family)
MLPDGRRLHLCDGPIDLIIDELCGELALLRQPCTPETDWPQGRTARRMTAAVLPYASRYFITPMAAVAGAVAEEILSAMRSVADLSRAYVNDGGDISLHLQEGEKFEIGIIDRPDRPSLFGTTTITSSDRIRGIATSGWRGRSFSHGIADAITVLAERAAAADAAATIIANAVDLPGHPAILRVAACDLSPDTDLGNRPVTQAVGELSISEVNEALARGRHTAALLLKLGLIRAAALHLRGVTRVVGDFQSAARFTETERKLVNA